MKNIFYPIPDAPEYEINKHGEVRNCKTGKILKPYKCKGHLTSQIYIPKYKIRRTAGSLYRQAFTFQKEKDINNSWLEIPNFSGLYEINSRGKVRNAQTKRTKQTRLCNGTECVMLSLNGKSVNRGINSLLWEVHGIIKTKQHERTCSVKIEKQKEIRFFQFQKDCVEFLCKREFYSKTMSGKSWVIELKNFAVGKFLTKNQNKKSRQRRQQISL